MIQFRKSHPVLSRSQFLRDADVTWHGKEPYRADWSIHSRFLALSLPDYLNHYELYIAFNAQFEPATFYLPERKKEFPWLRMIDTSKQSPEDIVEEENAPLLKEASYTLPPYSSLILKSYM